MNAVTGTARLARLALRRDRVQLRIWIGGITLMLATALSAIASTYPTDASRAAVLRAVMDTPAVLVLRGVARGPELGPFIMFQQLAFLGVLAGLMSTMAVVRHTRQNEETGRSEMIGATAVGRHAPLAAALLVVAGANAVLGVLVALVLISKGLPAAGAVAAGAALGLVGLSFAGIAAVAAQIFQNARAANGLAAAAIGLAYLLRGYGDAFGEVAPDRVHMTSAWPSWLSPIGWAGQVHPFAGERWWVFALPVAFVAGTAGCAFALTARRDVGLGMIGERAGRAAAPTSLRGPFGLAWRLQRGTWLAWTVGAVVFSAVVGSLGEAVEKALGDSEGAAAVIVKISGGAESIVDGFFAAMMGTMGLLAAGYTAQALLRLHGEEAAGHAEAVLATATSRPRWLAAHAACAVLGSGAMLLLCGLAAGVVRGLSDGDLGGALRDLVPAGLVQWPAALALAGFIVAAFGLLPRLATGLTSAALVASLVGSLFGDLLNLPQALQDISPFSHIPAVPVVAPTAAPLLALVAVAVALGAVGVASFRLRDLAL